MSSVPLLPTSPTRTRRRHGTVLAVASGAAFLAMLDATVVNLAVADLHSDFPDVAVPDLSWVITIYAIVFAALLAPGGRIADLVGRRALLTVGAALFTIVVNMRATTQSLGTGSGMTLVDQVHAIALLFVLVGVGSTTYSWRVSLGPGGPARALRVNRTVGAIASAGYLAATGSVIAVAVTTG